MRNKRSFYGTQKLCTLVFSFFVLIHGSTAQQHLVDSLSKLLEQPMADSNRAVSMMRLAVDYEVIDTAKAYLAYRHAIKFASDKKLYYFLGRIYHNQSYLLGTAARYTESLASLDTAIRYYQEAGTSKAKKWEANAYGDIANMLRGRNELQQSLQYHLKCIELLKQLKLESDLALRYSNISLLFGNIQEFDKQREYANQAVVYAKRSGSRLNLQMAYTIMTYACSMRDENKLAKEYLDSAHVLFDEYSNIDFMATYYLVSAQVYKKLNLLDSAFHYFEKCLAASSKRNYSHGMAESHLQMGAIAILQKKYPDAERYLLIGIEEAKAINNYDILDMGYKYLSDIYAVTGRYKQAYDFLWKYKDISDSILNLESKKNMLELEKKYETTKKDAQLKLQQVLLQKKDMVNYFLIASAFILIIIFLLSLRNYKQKQKIQRQRISELETEKQLTATEAVLKGEEQERSRLAKDLHDGLGGMLSGIKYSFNTMKGNLIMTPENHQAFQRSMDMLDGSIKEMRRVAHNMMPEALVKFGLDAALNDFCNDINQSGAIQVSYQSINLVNANIDQTTSITIYRIIQELISNSIRHASAKKVLVQVTKTSDQLAVTVEDDGSGFDTTLLSQSKGIGWTNIQHRVDFLQGKLDINSQIGKGTSVYIEFNT